MRLQENQFPHLKIPRILPFLSVAILDLQGKTSEGIFRVPGDVDAVAELVSDILSTFLFWHIVHALRVLIISFLVTTFTRDFVLKITAMIRRE
jgi:hypothetical protein